MWHSELGMSTIDIWEAEERQKRIWEYRRKQQYQKIAYGLAALLHRRLALQDEVETRMIATHDMIEEGGPIYDNEQGGHDD